MLAKAQKAEFFMTDKSCGGSDRHNMRSYCMRVYVFMQYMHACVHVYTVHNKYSIYSTHTHILCKQDFYFEGDLIVNVFCSYIKTGSIKTAFLKSMSNQFNKKKCQLLIYYRCLMKHNMRSYCGNLGVCNVLKCWVCVQNKHLSAVFLCSGCFRSLCAGCWSLSIIIEPSNRCTASLTATAWTRPPTPAASSQVSTAVSELPAARGGRGGWWWWWCFAELETELQQKPKTFCVTQLTSSRNLWKNTVVLCVNSWVHIRSH